MLAGNIELRAAYFACSDLYKQDSKLDCSLLKGYVDLPLSLFTHLITKKNVDLAIAVFCETTVAASKSQRTNTKCMHDFLTLIHTWWKVVNAKILFAPNPLGNALVKI